MDEKNNKFLLRHGSSANKIRILPPDESYYKRIYNITPTSGSMGIHQQHSKYYQRTMAKETDEQVLEKMDIKVIEQFLRKKKLLKIDNL